MRREDGLHDMPQGARYILNATLRAHGDALGALRTRDGRRTLREVAAEGAASNDASVVVSAALALKDELLALDDPGVKVLLAVDDYNALYHRTEFGEAIHPLHRRLLRPEELRLAAGFRLLEQPAPRRGLAIAAPTHGAGLPADLAVPLPRRSRVHVPRFDLHEVQALASYYGAADILTCPPDDDAVARGLFLSNGNARELRRNAALLLGPDDALGPSMGYKAKDGVRRRLQRGDEL